IPHAVATIVPFDVRSRVEELVARQAEGTAPEPTATTAVDAPAPTGSAAPTERGVRPTDNSEYDRPTPPPGVTPIGTLTQPGRSIIEGRVHAVEIRPVEHNTVLAGDVADATGEVTA